MAHSKDPLVGASKFMSLVLRHDPAAADVTLDPNGWVEIDRLVAGSRGKLSHDLVARVVRENDKKRFALSDDGARVRAVQGHSVAVELDLRPSAPPETLFHGTVERFIAAIMREGLDRRSRQHVHLSADAETATKVGARRGEAIILEVAAGAMERGGHTFFRAENGVWLTDAVPPRFITRR